MRISLIFHVESSWQIFLRIDFLLNASSCLIAPPEVLIINTPRVTSSFSGAHLLANPCPTILPQFSDIICSGLLSAPIFHVPHIFSTISSMVAGGRFFLGSPSSGKPVKSAISFLSFKFTVLRKDDNN